MLLIFLCLLLWCLLSFVWAVAGCSQPCFELQKRPSKTKVAVVLVMICLVGNAATAAAATCMVVVLLLFVG